MEPSKEKENIRRYETSLKEMRTKAVEHIIYYINYLNSVSSNTDRLFISADKNPYLLSASQIEIQKIYLNTDDGPKGITVDGTLIPINSLPVEDIIKLWSKLYFQ